MAESIVTKRCSHCREFKSFDEFNQNRHAKDGKQNQCRTCQRASNLKYVRGHKDSFAAYQAAYRKTEARKKTVHEYYIRIKHKHTVRRQARAKIRRAVQAGRIVRPDTLLCCRCSENAVEYHHHLGYEPDHWLDVVPVCKKCHPILDNRVILDA